MCRSRRELSNAYLLAKIGVDTAENEPLEVWGENSIQYSLHSLIVQQSSHPEASPVAEGAIRLRIEHDTPCTRCGTKHFAEVELNPTKPCQLVTSAKTAICFAFL